MSYTPLPNALTGVQSSLINPVQNPTQQPNSPWSWDAFYGSQGQNGFENGWGMSAINGISGLAQSWLGLQQLNLAKDQFAFQKDSFIQQYDQQASDLNRRLEDRQRARLSANPNGYQSVGEYMDKHKASSYGG